MPGIEWQVAILGVASVADRNRSDSTGHDPVDDDRREKNRGEPDPAELPADSERQGERDREKQATEALIEVFLQEEGAVPAERAAFDRPRRRDLETRRVALTALLTPEIAGIGRRMVLRRQADRAVVAGSQAGAQAGKPVATVR